MPKPSKYLSEMRREIAAVAAWGLQGEALADAIITRLCHCFGGQVIYLPKHKPTKRDPCGSFLKESPAMGNSHPGKTDFLIFP